MLDTILIIMDIILKPLSLMLLLLKTRQVNWLGQNENSNHEYKQISNIQD